MHVTQEGTVIGSPQFMSPEQCRSQAVDSRSDIYSLGATYYALLTGRPPFGSGPLMALMTHHCTSPTPNPRDLVPEIPAVCVDILMIAMAKNPEARFHTAEEMRNALEAALVDAPKIAYEFLIPADTLRQSVRKLRPSAGMRAVLDAAQADKVTPHEDAHDVANAASAQDSPSPIQERVAMLEAALARAPTAPLTPPMLPAGYAARAQSRTSQRSRRGKKEASLLVRWRYALFALVTLSILATATVIGWPGQQLGDAEPVKNPALAQTLKVGILHSLSGSLATVSRPIVDATLLAIDEINDQGGLLGLSIEPVVQDGKSDFDSYAAATEQLILRDKVISIFGAGDSEGRRGIGRIVEKYDHLLLYPGDDEGLEASANIFYLGGTPAQRILPTLRHCIVNLNLRRIFLLGSHPQDFHLLSPVLRDEIKELGGKVVGERTISGDEPDFAAVFKKISSADSDLVVSAVRGDLNLFLFRAFKKRDKHLSNLRMLTVAFDENLLTLLADIDLSGNYLAGNYFQTVPRPKNLAFLERFRRKYGSHRVISESMEAAYSGVYLWAQAVRMAGSSQPAQIRRTLKSQFFDGPAGPYRIDPKSNHVWKAWHLARITSGNRIELLQSSVAELNPQVSPLETPSAQLKPPYRE